MIMTKGAKAMMKKFMDWLSDSFAPKMNEVSANPWVSGVSSALMRVLPFILVGSLGFFYSVFRSYIPVLPDAWKLIQFSFGLLTLFLAFLVPYQTMEKHKLTRYQVTGGLTSISVLIMLLNPVFSDNGIISFSFDRLGASGMLVAFACGLFVSLIFYLYSKLNVLADNDSLPDFIKEWINQIIPITCTLLIGLVSCFYFKLDIYGLILALFSPIAAFGQTLPGLILIVFIPTFFYSMGISSWLFSPVQQPIFMAGITANIALVAAGNPATNIVTSETVYTAALIMMGGTGATLCLNILMIRSKSKKLSTLGKVCIGPSIFNINEPVIFGAPIALNPLMMVPMWINGLTGPIIVWFAMRSGLMHIPEKMIQVGQIPAPFSSVMVTQDIRAVGVYVVLFVIYLATWYPFFKAYEKQCLIEEQEEMHACAANV